MTKHPLDIISLGAGLVFLAFALAYLFGVVFDATPSGAVMVPLAIAGLGATCLAALLVKQRRERSALPSDNQ